MVLHAMQMRLRCRTHAPYEWLILCVRNTHRGGFAIFAFLSFFFIRLWCAREQRLIRTICCAVYVAYKKEGIQLQFCAATHERDKCTARMVRSRRTYIYSFRFHCQLLYNRRSGVWCRCRSMPIQPVRKWKSLDRLHVKSNSQSWKWFWSLSLSWCKRDLGTTAVTFEESIASMASTKTACQKCVRRHSFGRVWTCSRNEEYDKKVLRALTRLPTTPTELCGLRFITKFISIFDVSLSRSRRKSLPSPAFSVARTKHKNNETINRRE